MLIGDVFIRRETGSLILRDVDGSEAFIPLQDSLELLDWLYKHEQDIKAAIAEIREAEKVQEWNSRMDQRDHTIVASSDKPWLPLRDGE